MNYKKQKRTFFYKGKKHSRNGGKKRPPGVGFSKATGLIVGSIFNPIFGLFGWLIGDGKRERGLRKSYEKGYAGSRSRRHRRNYK